MTQLPRHPLAMRPTITAVLDTLDGHTVEGGCDQCGAEQRIERVRGLARVTRITIVHDPRCPVLARKTRR